MKPEKPEKLSSAGNIVAQQATISKQYGEGESKVTNETLVVHVYATTPATVEVGMGLTLNLGNFESARIDVRLSTPCYREEIEAAYAHTRQWVEDRLAAEAADIRANKPELF